MLQVLLNNFIAVNELDQERKNSTEKNSRILFFRHSRKIYSPVILYWHVIWLHDWPSSSPLPRSLSYLGTSWESNTFTAGFPLDFPKRPQSWAQFLSWGICLSPFTLSPFCLIFLHNPDREPVPWSDRPLSADGPRLPNVHLSMLIGSDSQFSQFRFAFWVRKTNVPGVISGL